MMAEGRLHRRAYSISGASPNRRRLRITAKRAPGGTVSSFLAYNDTDIDQSLSLGAGVFVDPAGAKHTGAIVVPTFGAVVLFPEAWTIDPVKQP